MLRLMLVTMSRVAVALGIAAATLGCGQAASGPDQGASTPTSDAPLARWHLAEDPGPSDKTLSLLVHEIECASGQSAEGRIATPDVEYRQDAVVITMRVERRSDSEQCPGNPDTPYTLELQEPVGTRALLDGGMTPPASPEPAER
jgi:hypothetical protein